MRKLELDNREILEVETSDIFGWELILDIYECNPIKVRDPNEIVTFMNRLCTEILGMKVYGKPMIERFGKNRPVNTGYTIIQFVETSSVVAHFSELKNSVYLDIFSCQLFDPIVVSDFCHNFFEAETVNRYFLERK
jgi:S-adenosylmethionine/arginine decarboxylase-like enzyme